MVSSSNVCTQKDVNIGTIMGLTPTTEKWQGKKAKSALSFLNP